VTRTKRNLIPPADKQGKEEGGELRIEEKEKSNLQKGLQLPNRLTKDWDADPSTLKNKNRRKNEKAMQGFRRRIGEEEKRRFTPGLVIPRLTVLIRRGSRPIFP